MKDSPKGLIEAIADAYRITLEDETHIECLFFVYAHVFLEISDRIKQGTLKDSIIKVKKACEDICGNIEFIEFNRDITPEIKASIEKIMPTLVDVIGHLEAMIDVCQYIIQSPHEESPAEIARNYERTRLFKTGLRTCSRYVTFINSHMGRWCNEEKIVECQKQKTASPTPPTSLAKERKNRGKRPA